MSSTEPAPEPMQADDRPAPARLRPWLLSGAAGAVAGVLITLLPIVRDLPASLMVGMAIAVALVVQMLLLPWKQAMDTATRQRDAERLLQKLRRIISGERDEPLRELILNRQDELGELSQLVHDLIVDFRSDRIEARMLHRTMHDNIRKATDRATAELRRQAITDPLTGLGNLRTLERAIDEIVHGDRKRPSWIAVIAIDLDGFKEVNDELGHDIGDECLRFLGSVLRSSVRPEDCVVRQGGDEFIILLPSAKADIATRVSERLRDLFHQMPWPHEDPPRPTLSIGIADAQLRSVETIDDLLRQADHAMYHAKRNGKSRIVHYRGLCEAA